MNMQTVFTYLDGSISSNTLDIDGFNPIADHCPEELLQQQDVQGKKLQPFVNGNDDTDIVYVVLH